MVTSDATVIVGIDCATESRYIGLARAELREVCELTDVVAGAADPVDQIGRWLRQTTRAVIALDAPLGWPILLSDTLPEHRAGQRLVANPELLFCRHTDNFVRRTIGKRPLDVGADRIARTAFRSLELLDRIRTRIQSEIPLAWSPEKIAGTRAIEVYPAATLAAHGLPSSQYKKPAHSEARSKITASLEGRMIGLSAHRSLLEVSSDALDAVVCVLAALDFLEGMAVPPTMHEEIVRKEGWIWVRKPGVA